MNDIDVLDAIYHGKAVPLRALSSGQVQRMVSDAGWLEEFEEPGDDNFYYRLTERGVWKLISEGRIEVTVISEWSYGKKGAHFALESLTPGPHPRVGRTAENAVASLLAGGNGILTGRGRSLWNLTVRWES